MDLMREIVFSSNFFFKAVALNFDSVTVKSSTSKWKEGKGGREQEHFET